jgi:hypothetical protein
VLRLCCKNLECGGNPEFACVEWMNTATVRSCLPDPERIWRVSSQATTFRLQQSPTVFDTFSFADRLNSARAPLGTSAHTCTYVLIVRFDTVRDCWRRPRNPSAWYSREIYFFNLFAASDSTHCHFLPVSKNAGLRVAPSNSTSRNLCGRTFATHVTSISCSFFAASASRFSAPSRFRNSSAFCASAFSRFSLSSRTCASAWRLFADSLLTSAAALNWRSTT